MKKIFQYAVLFHEYNYNELGQKAYSDTLMIVKPTFILAESEKEVIFKATREIDEIHANLYDNVEIVISFFGSGSSKDHLTTYTITNTQS